jgi:hypothetical protein
MTATSSAHVSLMTPVPTTTERRCACANCCIISRSAYFSQTRTSQGGDHLLPYGAPGPSALGGGASSALFDSIRRECFACGASRQFATPSGGSHRIDLHRVSDGSPESGPAGERIPAVTRCGFGIPPASFPPGRISFLSVDRCVRARPASFLVFEPGRSWPPTSPQLTS